MRIRTALIASTLALSALAGVAAATTPPPPATASVCQEDDPCWDCHALGNRVCGPSSPAEEDYAWKAWEYGNGAHSLKMDPSRAFRVEYVGSALDYPRSLADNETAVVGKDSHWYVFRAAYLD